MRRRLLPCGLGLLLAASPLHAKQDLAPQGKPATLLLGRGEAAALYCVLPAAGLVYHIEGPGTLSGFVKTHNAPGETEERQGVLRLAGVPGLPDSLPLALAPSRIGGYADDRPGSPSRGTRLSFAIPAGRHALSLRGELAGGGELFVALYYDGPPQWETTPLAVAAPPKPRPANERFGLTWGLGVSLGFTYEDNVFQMSEAFRQEYLQRLYWNQEKFKEIERLDDLILTPSLDLTAQRKFLALGATRFTARYSREQYALNTILDNHEFRFGLRQAFGKQSLEFYYAYSPSKYLRQLNDRPPLVSEQTPVVSEQFRLERNRFVSTWRQRLHRNLNASVALTKKLYYYNKPHLENDLNTWGVDLNATWTIARPFRLSLTYAYEDADARAIDVVGEELETSPASDGTYKGNTYNAELRWAPAQAAIKRWLPELRLRAQYGVDYYSAEGTQTIADDPYHVGRQDNTYTYQVKGGRPLPALLRNFGLAQDVDLDPGFGYAERDVDSPWWGDIKEDKNYISRTYWIGFSSTLF
ncbi:hypothetical protein FJ251_10830 [bacterium]|nr:hypothetical protein [bacterium]